MKSLVRKHSKQLVPSTMECKLNQWTSTPFSLSFPQMSVVSDPRGLGSSHMCAGQGCWGVAWGIHVMLKSISRPPTAHRKVFFAHSLPTGTTRPSSKGNVDRTSDQTRDSAFSLTRVFSSFLTSSCLVTNTGGRRDRSHPQRRR